MNGSPQLQAKKALRDEKRKKLQAMMDQQRKAKSSEGERLTAAVAVESSSTAGESSREGPSSSQPSPSTYVSYQHAGAANEDLEQGHVVVLKMDNDNNNRGQLLREQAQSLIRNDDHSVVVSQSEGLLAKWLDTKGKAVGATVLMVLFYWWL
jgi:hypothetical protein